MIENTTDKEVAIMLSDAQAKAEAIIAEGEAEYMRILSEAYSDPEKTDFYSYVRALDALKNFDDFFRFRRKFQVVPDHIRIRLIYRNRHFAVTAHDDFILFHIGNRIFGRIINNRINTPFCIGYGTAQCLCEFQRVIDLP